MIENSLRGIAYLARGVSRGAWKLADRLDRFHALTDMLSVLALLILVWKGKLLK